MLTSRYDVTARAAGPERRTANQIRQMTQTLLADRFALKLHTESKDLPIYRMVVAAKPGKELHKATACAAPDCPSFDMSIGGQITARGVTMEDFAHALTDITSRALSATCKPTSPASTIFAYPGRPTMPLLAPLAHAARPRPIPLWPPFLQLSPNNSG